jgi:hypothetical protein
LTATLPICADAGRATATEANLTMTALATGLHGTAELVEVDGRHLTFRVRAKLEKARG